MIEQIYNKNNNNSILVLDDEFDIVSMIQISLQNAFKVCTFTHPIAALERFKSNFKEYIIVISDIRMSPMNGYEFAKKVKEIKPEVKTILMSAFEISDIELSTVLSADIKIVDAFLQKPFSIRTLRNIIMEMASN